MTIRHLAIAALLTLGAAGPAAAQTPASTAKPGPNRAKEFSVGAVLAGPSSVGSAAAELNDGSGSPSVTLFRVENRLALGYGVEANIAVELRRALWVEVSGGWTRSSVDSRITNDFEDAETETASLPMSRFLVEGAMLRYFRERGRTAWFIRVNGGWMRETAGGNTLTGDGLIAGGGLGFRHWWRTNGKGSVKRVGLRVEGRAVMRSGGISLGEKGLRFGPAGAGHIVFGF